VYEAKLFIDALIDYPKMLVAAVNGPVLGIACTTLALCDFIYCSDDAFFATPFMDVALCAEGCSSVLFPRILGPMRANEMLVGHSNQPSQVSY
jgi:Delta3-Delta2-enoyl-CoA isomerase